MVMLESLSQLIFNVYEAFTVALFLREKDQLICRSSVTFAGSFDRNRSISVEGSLPGWVIKHGEPLVIPNFDKDEETLGYYGTPEGIKSFMGYPMEDEGVLVVDSKKKWVFTDKEKKILGSFVSVIYQEIEREKKYQEIEETIDELRTERRIIDLFTGLVSGKLQIGAVFAEAISVSGADFCFVCLDRDGRVRIEELSGIHKAEIIGSECTQGSSVAMTIMERGRELLLPHNSGYLREMPLFFPGDGVKPRQFFGFPLLSEDTVLGALGFVSSSEAQLKETSIGLLREISTLLSMYYGTLWMRENLERIRDIEPVTGSIHFPAFVRITDEIIKKGEPFALLSVKLPHVDLYNRKMGYEFTDSLLRKVFQVIRYCAGRNALITREGGGHFYIMIKGNKIVELNNILKILHYTISKNISEEKALEGAILVDSGMSNFPEDGDNLWDLVAKAASNQSRKSKRS
jgi:GGDEF domain-containing protein